MIGEHRFAALWLPVISIALLLVGCVSGPDDVVVLPPIDTEDGLYGVEVVKAWITFDSGNFDDSILAFTEALNMDPSRPDAYLGLGWCYAMIDDLQSSLSNLELAIVNDPANPDGYASMAFVYLAQNEHASAVGAADRAIQLGGEEYVFYHIAEVNTRNLRLLMAECYYTTGQYAEAQTQVDALKPDNELDQNSDTYKQDLLLEIESLRSLGPVLGELNI